MPRIPQVYRKYLANYKVPEGRYDYMTRKYSRELMAPNSAAVKRYLTGRYPDVRNIDINEVYGPYLPSEQELMGGNRFASAYQRDIDRRREQLLQDYYDRIPEEERVSDEEAFDVLDWKTRNELDKYLDERQSRLPVIPRYRFGRTKRDGMNEYYDAFTEEGAKDILRMRGVPEDDIGWISPYPPIPLKYR